MYYGLILRLVISKEGKLSDLHKIVAIINMNVPKTPNDV
jgi:hypothetical protein